MKNLRIVAVLCALTCLVACKDPETEKKLKAVKEQVVERDEDLEAASKKLKEAESARKLADERAATAEAKLKDAEKKLKALEDPNRLSGPVTIPSSEPTSGSATCDKYWVRVRACNDAAVKNAPPSVQANIKKTMDDAEKQTKDAWKNMDAATMEAACKAMNDSLAQNPNCPKQ